MPEPLPGRRSELARLLALLGPKDKGQAGRTILITGQPGVGKTRLVCEALRDHPVVAQVTFPRARFATPGLGLQRLAEARAKEATELAHELRASKGAPSKWKTLAVYDAADRLLRTNAPCLIVLDDLQWADDLTLGWLSRSADLLDSADVTIVMVARSELPVSHPLSRALVSLSRRHRLERLDLRPLERDGVRDITADAGFMLDDAALEQLHRKTAGLPLAIIDLLARSSSEPAPEVRLRDLLGNPGSSTPAFISLVLEDIAELHTDSALLLNASSLVPQPASELLVRQVVALPSEMFDVAIAQCLATGLIEAVPPSGIRFRHELHRECVQEQIPIATRRSLHRQIAAALALNPNGQERVIADQLIEGGMPEEARGWLEQAADDATDRHDYGAALAHLREALSLSSPQMTDAHVMLIEKLDAAARFSNRSQEGLQIVERALQPDCAPAHRARLLLARARLCAELGLLEERLAALREARKTFIALQDDAGQALACGQLALPADWVVPTAERIDWGVEGLRLAQHADDPYALAVCGGNLAAALARNGDTTCFRLWNETISRVENKGGPSLNKELLRNLANWTWNAVDYGRYAEAAEVTTRGIRHTSERIHDPGWQQSFRVLDAVRLWREGRWDDALARVHNIRKFPLAETAIVTGLRAAIAFERDSRADVSPLEAAARDLQGHANSWETFAVARLMAARAARREPRPARGAMSLIDRIVQSGSRVGWDDLLAPLAMADVTTYRRALATLGELRPAGDRGSAAWMMSQAISKLDAEPSVAVDSLLDAAAAYERIGEPYSAGVALEVALRAPSLKTSRAIDMAVRAASIYDALGAGRSLNRVLKHAPRSRALERFRSSRGSFTSGRLSQREVEVAELCRRGLTGVEIAVRLGISRRTAEKHIEQVKQKLGMRRKSELVRRLSDEDLPSAD